MRREKAPAVHVALAMLLQLDRAQYVGLIDVLNAGATT